MATTQAHCLAVCSVDEERSWRKQSCGPSHLTTELLAEQEFNVRLIVDDKHTNGHDVLPFPASTPRGIVTVNSVK
jgi:hypothetical protein